MDQYSLGCRMVERNLSVIQALEENKYRAGLAPYPEDIIENRGDFLMYTIWCRLTVCW
jgi:hypothetical protein